MRHIVKALLAAALVVATALPAAHAEGESTKAINFKFTDINGKSLQLDEFRGKWVLVNFWAPWCPLCWVEVPALNELNKRKDFVVIGVGLDYGPDEGIVRDAAMRHNLDFQAIIAGGARRNPNSPFRQVGPVDFYPTSYLYAPDGEIVMFIPGQVRLQQLHAFMDSWHDKNTQMAGKDADAAQPGGNHVKEVDYKQRGKTPTGPAKTKKTTTY